MKDIWYRFQYWRFMRARKRWFKEFQKKHPIDNTGPVKVAA